MQEATIHELTTACTTLAQMASSIKDETAEVISTNDPVKVIKHYDALRKVNALIKESREALSEIEEKLSRNNVPDVMRAHNIKTTTIEGVGRVSLGTRWSASMPDKVAGFEWLRTNNHGGVIQETVNAQTLGALAKELNEDGVELPQPTFATSVMTYTSITKVK